MYNPSVKVALIANPRAGRCRSARVAPVAADLLQRGGWQVDLQTTSGVGHATELARDAAAAGYDLVVGVGGDGTLSELVNGLVGTEVPCGLVPCGTGNDFARFVGISQRTESAVEQLLSGCPRVVDLGLLRQPSMYFVNIVGVGFDAAVAERINRRRRFTGGLTAYLPAILAEVAANSFVSAAVQIDGKRYEDELLLVAVANGNAYGSGFRIAPRAVCDDGLLDVVLVRRTGRLDVLYSLALAYGGWHEKHPKVEMLRATEVKIEADRPAPATVDGDILAYTPLEIEVSSGAGLLWL